METREMREGISGVPKAKTREELLEEDSSKFPTIKELQLNIKKEITEKDRPLTKEEKERLKIRYLENLTSLIKKIHESPRFKEGEAIFWLIEDEYCEAIKKIYDDAFKTDDKPIYRKVREISRDLFKEAKSPSTTILCRDVLTSETLRILGLSRFRRKEEKLESK